MSFLRKYGKSLAAFAVAVVTAVQAALSDGHVTPVEGVQIAVSIATAAGVWLIPIHPTWTWTKTALAVLLAVLNEMTTLVVAGWGGPAITELLLAALTVAAVGSAPAQSPPGDNPPPSPTGPKRLIG